MKKIYLILIYILVTNCSIEKVSKHHGIYHLENKHQKLILSKTNKNDIISLLGPPSTTGTFDNDLWIYVEMEKSSTSLFTLGNKKIIKNNVLILEIDDKGLLAKKDFLNIDKMNDIKFTEGTTSNIYKKNTFVYEFLSSMRQRLNDPLGKRKKID